MPTYEYKCKKCGEYFEIEQRITEDPIKKCILCKKGDVHRVISAAGIIFKGSGFHVTDYSKKGTTQPSNANKKNVKKNVETQHAASTSKSSKNSPKESSPPQSK